MITGLREGAEPSNDVPKAVMRIQALVVCLIIMKPRRFLTSFKIGVMMIFIGISATVRPSPTVRHRIDRKVLVLYLLLVGVTAFLVD